MEAVKKWLEEEGLESYASKFDEFGFDSMKHLKNLNSKHLASMGVKEGHKGTILSKVKQLEQKSTESKAISTTPVIHEEESFQKLFFDLQKKYEIDQSEILPPKGRTEKPLIADGGFGCVYEAEWKKTRVALKVQKTNSPLKESYGNLAEFKRLIDCSHPTIIRAFGFYGSKPENVTIVLEYAEKGSLDTILRNSKKYPDDIFAWPIRVGILDDAATALNHLHTQKPAIIHRDLKASNILIRDDWTACLGDFGLSKEAVESQTISQTAGIGTRRWMAPEVENGTHYGVKADVWSFGMIMYEILARDFPSIEFVTAAKQGKALTIPAIDDEPPRGYNRLMRDCLNLNPDARPTCLQIIERLEAMGSPRKRLQSDFKSGVPLEGSKLEYNEFSGVPLEAGSAGGSGVALTRSMSTPSPSVPAPTVSSTYSTVSGPFTAQTPTSSSSSSSPPAQFRVPWKLIDYLMQQGTKKQGVFTKVAENTAVTSLLSQLEDGKEPQMDDPFVAAQALKLSLKKLPPLFTFENYSSIIGMTGDSKVGPLTHLCRSLPTDNLATLRHLFTLLGTIVKNNASDAKSLGYTFGQYLIRPKTDEPMWKLAQTMKIVNAVIEEVLVNSDQVLGTQVGSIPTGGKSPPLSISPSSRPFPASFSMIPSPISTSPSSSSFPAIFSTVSSPPLRPPRAVSSPVPTSPTSASPPQASLLSVFQAAAGGLKKSS